MNWWIPCIIAVAGFFFLILDLIASVDSADTYKIDLERIRKYLREK